MNQSQEIERGRQASAVLENPAFSEAFAALEKEITNQWKLSEKPDEREKLHLSLTLLTRLESVLKRAVQTGTVAQRIVEREQNLLQRLGQRFKPD